MRLVRTPKTHALEVSSFPTNRRKTIGTVASNPRLEAMPLNPGVANTSSQALQAERKRIVVFDFFCGCGGTSEGFRESGMDVVWALDVDHSAARTFRNNFPHATFHEGDVNRRNSSGKCPSIPDVSRCSADARRASRSPGSKHKRSGTIPVGIFFFHLLVLSKPRNPTSSSWKTFPVFRRIKAATAVLSLNSWLSSTGWATITKSQGRLSRPKITEPRRYGTDSFSWQANTAWRKYQLRPMVPEKFRTRPCVTQSQDCPPFAPANGS